MIAVKVYIFKQILLHMDSPIKKTFFLDILRGLAAFYVLVGHAKWLLWEGYTEGYKNHPELYSFIDKIQVFGFASFAFGHQAVMLFFVLSGFVIHYSSYNQSLKSGEFSILTYLGKRIKRIYPPFLFAILLTFVLDMVGMNLGYNIYFGTTNFWLMNKNIISDLSVETLLGNLGMLQTLVTPVWGTNGPLWSLMYEWWFYILYIPVFFINKKQPVITALIIGLIFIASLYIPVEIYKWVTVINYFFAWYLGVIVADIYMGRIQGVKTIGGLALFIGFVLVGGTYIMGAKYMNDYFIAIVFVGVIYMSLKYYMKLKAFSILQPLSDFSYTLYVIHMPILVLMSGWLQRKYNGGLPMHFGYVFLSIGVCMLVAWGAHFLVETPFVKKKQLKSKMTV